MMESSFADVRENLKQVRHKIEEAALGCGRNPGDVRLMAVTKTVPPALVNEAVGQGVGLLGENRAQELLEKYGSYNREGVSIHFIGHLQTNKVRQIADKVDMIQSVDSLRLAREIERQAAAIGRTMDVLIEVNVGGEHSKSGVAPREAEELAFQVAELEHVRVRGLMAIPPVCDTEVQAERYFSRLQQLLVDIKAKNIDNVNMLELSMGMSDDYAAAIRQGSTLVRLGRALFGPRG